MRLIELIENYGEPISNNIFNELLSHEEDVLRFLTLIFLLNNY